MMEEEKYDKLASEEDLQQDFTEVKRISRELSTSCNDFVYNAFQAWVSLKIMVAEGLIKVVKIPTGGGKSFIATILADQFRRLNRKPVIVTTQSFLVDQYETMLGQMRHRIKVLTMQSILTKTEEYDAFIIDEADECFMRLGCTVNQ